MNEHDRKREEQLERLFAATGPVPALTPDPALPMRVRALAASEGDRRTRTVVRPRWAWVSLASAAFALSLIMGGYIGYRAWTSTEETTADSGDAEVLVTAWLQSGFVEDIGQSDAAGNEVTE